MQYDLNLSARIYIFPIHKRIADIKRVANALLARAPNKRAWTRSNLENGLRANFYKAGLSIKEVEKEIQLFQLAVDAEIHKAEVKEYLFGDQA